MPNLNKVMLMGNLTRDPELRHTPSNVPVCNFGIATNHTWNDANGQEQNEVTFVDVAAWGKRGEVINQYLSKGDPIFIEGRLKLEQWTDDSGNKRSKISVVADRFEFIKQRGDNNGQQPANNQAQANTAPVKQAEFEIDDDDIPF